MWNDPNDPMPIKTTNMAGLQKWEETEDYIIYLCKDATMTTVQNYVTGTFQTFQERKTDIESSQELLRSYAIEWNTQDSIDLINEINNEALAELEATPMLLTENGDNEIQVLSARAVPVTYECCFRMDKKSGEFYIGEGYENLFKGLRDYIGSDYICSKNGNFTLLNDSGKLFSYPNNISEELAYTLSFEFNVDLGLSDNTITNVNGGASSVPNSTPCYYKKQDKKFYREKYGLVAGGASNLEVVIRGVPMGSYKLTKGQITKTTPKPFVKSVMPNGKLAFVTNAELTTHSFISKSSTHKEVIPNGNLHYPLSGGMFFTLQPDMIAHNYDTIASSVIRKLTDNTNGKTAVFNATITLNELGLIILAPSKINLYKTNESFKQLLIYKANFTETELKAELAKDIKLI